MSIAEIHDPIRPDDQKPTVAGQATDRGHVRPRPALFRALGNQEPPCSIDVEGCRYLLERTIKHDSWAATALYRSAAPQPDHESKRIICKFNRQQPLGILPMKWLGNGLARRENRMYATLQDLPGIARGFSDIRHNGRQLKHAAAHEFIDGHPLRWHDRVSETFFQQLGELLAQVHCRNVAYVDLNKAENIIVDRAGNPCLIDFQISLKLGRWWPVSSLLRMLQQSDLYHLAKHARRCRPDLYAETQVEIDRRRPWWIRWHRRIAEPFRALRRGLLVRLGIRSGLGKAHSENFIEEGLRAAEPVKPEPANCGQPNSCQPSPGSKNAQGQEKPILRLYRLLRSAEYLRFAALSGETLAMQQFVDLCQRRPQHPDEHKMVTELQRATEHCRVVTLLQCHAFFVGTKCWDHQHLSATLQRLELLVSSSASTDEEAADPNHVAMARVSLAGSLQPLGNAS